MTFGNRAAFQKKKKRKQLSSPLKLFGFTVSAVDARALTGCACDNIPAHGARSIIGVVQLQWLYYNAIMLTTLAYGAEDLHFSAFIANGTHPPLSPELTCSLFLHTHNTGLLC